jgi:hypothetical protein
VFEAACVLQRSSNTTRSCTRHRQERHPVPESSAIQCNKCHGRKCMSHLLQDQGIHSVEALLFDRKDRDHQRWHTRHTINKMSDKRHVLDHTMHEKLGTRPGDLYFALAITATRYSTCMPHRPTTLPGWYDLAVQQILVSKSRLSLC